MKVQLIWGNADLVKLCREVLQEVSDGHSELVSQESDAQCADADIYIWDYSTERSLPAWVSCGNLQQHLFLVKRHDLDGFRAVAPRGAANVLLKPISRPTLLAYLGQPGFQDAERDNGTLRADKDEMLQCVIQANLRLQEYDQERTNFLARVVHDFRAPLTSISGYCALLLGGSVGEMRAGQHEALERIQSSASKLADLAEALMQLSAGRRQANRPKYGIADLNECADRVVQEAMPSLDQKDISISLEFAAVGRPLHFDVAKMERVLMNLVDNACKFTPRNGSIEIQGRPYFWERRLVTERRAANLERRKSTQSPANAYRVEIHDSGPGIPPQYLRKVFEEHTSYFGGADRSGGGLGLAICRSIVESHDGYIWADNIGDGTTVSFVLPYVHERACDLCASGKGHTA